MHRKRRSSPLPCVVLAATLLLAPASAMGKKVVVLDFVGAGNKLIRKKVADKLAETHELVSPEKVASEAKKLGLGTECNETNIMGVASVFSAEGVICGEISGAKGSRKLKLSVNNGGDAQEVASFIVPVGQWGLDNKVLKQVKTQANAALAKTWSWDTGGAEDETSGSEPAVEPEPEPEPVDEAEPEPPPPPPPEEGDEEPVEEPLPDPAPLEETDQALDEEPVDAADDVEDPLAHSKPSHVARKRSATVKKKVDNSRTDGNHALRLSVGLAMRFMRSYDPIGVDPNTVDPKDPNSQKVTLFDNGYSPGFGAGLSIDAELFPGAWISSGLAKMFGIGLNYRFVNGPGWQLRTSEGVQEKRVGKNHQFAVNARIRYHLLESWYLPVVTLKLGYHLQIYDMNEGNQQAPIPGVKYSSLDAGLALDQALWRDRVHVHFSYDFLYVIGFSNEVTAAELFGPAAGGIGHSIGGGFRGNIWGPIGYRLDVSYQRYTVTFKHVTGDFKIWINQLRDQYFSGLVYLTFVN